MTEIENDIIHNTNKDNDKLSSEKKLPKLKGFTFDDIVNSDEFPELPESIKYLEHTWIPMYVYSDIKVNSGIASLYMISAYPYDEKQPKVSYNELFRNLLKDTINLFGDYVFSENEHISNIEQLTEDNRLSYIYDVENYYLIAFFQDNVEESMVDITYYFVSKENPHTDGGEESAIIDYIMNNVKKPRINIYYKTNEGNFIIEYGKEKKLSDEKSMFEKKLRLR